MKQSALILNNIEKAFKQAGQELKVLDNANLDIKKGEIVALIGDSGSGKTTLLQVAGLLDTLCEGKIYIEGEDCSKINDDKRTKIRASKLGFIYQFHHLLPEFTAFENVKLAAVIAGINVEEAKQRSKKVLKELGLEKKLNSFPKDLSGGEQQRVAIARAIVKHPVLLLADEPTGNLDPTNSEMVLASFLNSVKKNKLAALIATHNYQLAEKMDRIVEIKNGSIVEVKK